MTTYDFSSQAQLFNIALAILEDYKVTSWSFGGGTALSYLYYQHRMSYDIDIFIENYEEIELLVNSKKEIMQNLGISPIQIESSPNAITFILETEGYGLKLDFVYSPALTSDPFDRKEVFGYSNIKVQTPLEIVAKKLKYREKATIRDFVDYAIAQEKDKILTRLKSENIFDIDRYFDMIEKFNQFDKATFDRELKGLKPDSSATKEDFEPVINAIMQPREFIDVAIDHTGEVVAFDEFIESYRSIYEELGAFEIYTIKCNGMTYKDVMKLSKNQIIELSNKARGITS